MQRFYERTEVRGWIGGRGDRVMAHLVTLHRAIEEVIILCDAPQRRRGEERSRSTVRRGVV
jgi:hypothetical protein|nr:hypothetical protein Q903MT_gene419 [Picea sitchensis]